MNALTLEGLEKRVAVLERTCVELARAMVAIGDSGGHNSASRLALAEAQQLLERVSSRKVRP